MGSIVDSVCGIQEGATKGYNPRQKDALSYHPQLAFLVGMLSRISKSHQLKKGSPVFPLVGQYWIRQAVMPHCCVEELLRLLLLIYPDNQPSFASCAAVLQDIAPGCMRP